MKIIREFVEITTFCFGPLLCLLLIVALCVPLYAFGLGLREIASGSIWLGRTLQEKLEMAMERLA